MNNYELEIDVTGWKEEHRSENGDWIKKAVDFRKKTGKLNK
jgi:hypothetical protein